MEASITLKSVGKTIGKNILLADLSFGVEKGSAFVLIGENGSGKSIILRLLVGLIEKDTGSLYIHGKDVSTRSISTRSICGYMPQVVNLDDEVTVKENLIIYGKLHGLKNNRIIKNIKHWSEVLGFSEYLNYLPYDLSYGYQKLVLFARCLIHEPEVLLLDEPTSGMDPGSRNRLWNVIDKIYKDKTIIFASQNFTEAERYSDRIAILHNGNIKMDGNLEKLIESTHGLTRYSITFSESISEEFMNQLKSFPRVKNPKLKGLELEFYSRERKQFFNVLKLAIDYGLSDLDTSICSLRDLYLGLTEGGLE